MKVLTSGEKVQLMTDLREAAGTVKPTFTQSVPEVDLIAIYIGTWHIAKISLM
jgi:hypothetical protein